MLSLLPVALFLVAHGFLYIIFAFIEPPAGLRRLFKIPSIFVFIPERYRITAGRLFVGILMIAVPWILSLKVVVWKP